MFSLSLSHVLCTCRTGKQCVFIEIQMVCPSAHTTSAVPWAKSSATFWKRSTLSISFGHWTALLTWNVLLELSWQKFLVLIPIYMLSTKENSKWFDPLSTKNYTYLSTNIHAMQFVRPGIVVPITWAWIISDYSIHHFMWEERNSISLKRCQRKHREMEKYYYNTTCMTTFLNGR